MLTIRLDALLGATPTAGWSTSFAIRSRSFRLDVAARKRARECYDVWNRTREEDQRRWLENLYQASCDMLRYFHDAQLDRPHP